MQIRRVRHDEAAIRRYVTDCWTEYQADLCDLRAAYALADDARQEAVDFHLDTLDAPSDRLWVALDDIEEPKASLSAIDATLAGFVRTHLRTPPERFDWPKRLEISDCWVDESYRGSGLADDLMARAVQQGREDGCADLTLTVGVENERALAYWEKLGFDVQGFGMTVPLGGVTLEHGGDAQSGSVDAGPRLRRVRADEAVMSRFVEECYVPFWRDMGEAVGEQHLSPDFDREQLVADLLDAYDTPDRRCWVALEECERPAAPLEEMDAAFAGWINAGLEPTDPFLDPPERLFVGNLYAAPAYRGTGLTDRLVARAMQYAREEGCVELTLGVEAGNDRAMAYYEKLGFEPLEQRMAVSLDAVDL